MGFLDNAKDKLNQAIDKHGDKISLGIDKAADLADQKTKGKYSDKIDNAAAKAKDGLDKLDGKDDDLGPTPPTTPPSTPRP
jgi:hypothetical protein